MASQEAFSPAIWPNLGKSDRFSFFNLRGHFPRIRLKPVPTMSKGKKEGWHGTMESSAGIPAPLLLLERVSAIWIPGFARSSTNVQSVPLDVLSDCFRFNRISRYRITGSICRRILERPAEKGFPETDSNDVYDARPARLKSQVYGIYIPDKRSPVPTKSHGNRDPSKFIPSKSRLPSYTLLSDLEYDRERSQR